MKQRKTKKDSEKEKTRKSESKPRRAKSPANAKGQSDLDVLRIALTFPSAGGGSGPIRLRSRMSTDVLRQVKPNPSDIDQALGRLESLGFETSARGRITASIRGSRSLFEKVFGTKLEKFAIDRERVRNCQAREFYFPGEDAPWQPQAEIAELIDDAYIQWPHIYLNQRFSAGPPSPLPPHIDYHHLRTPSEVAFMMNAARVHRENVTGRGVRVAMVDSGFAHSRHPYFQEHGYRTTTVLAAGATNVDEDANSHGTGESANLLAVAPDVDFVGVKLDNDVDPRAGASVLEGLQEAMKHDPQVISVSLGYDLTPTHPFTGQRLSNRHLTSLPNSLVALEAEIQAIVDDGVVVVFSAGNGHVAFPGMMPDVISAGGVYVDETGEMQASDYASAFRSRIYPSRHVPDVSGLVGKANNGAAYIMLPVQVGSDLDRLNDETGTGDGWGVFSGTSAAAPQIAGCCALLLQQEPSLTPAEVKSILRRTCRDVTEGSSNPASNEDDGPILAGPGPDGATGAGLVDVFAAWHQLANDPSRDLTSVMPTKSGAGRRLVEV